MTSMPNLASKHKKVVPVEISWRQVSAFIKTKGKKKKGDTKQQQQGGDVENPQPKAKKQNRKYLLRDVTGKLASGEMMALMGPSGAGKTTMLNVLAGRQGKALRLDGGDIRINGKQVSSKALKSFTGFVTQEDVMEPFLTVKETISFYARLRLPASMSMAEKNQRVNETIRLLGLEKCKDTYIGNSAVKGISGGEKKRVNIACEILSNPSILFLDEPTSGLDAFTALNLAKHLKMLAQETGMVIICTIHQPRSAIFELFDSLLLLGMGQTVYLGPTSKALSYFEEAGFPIPLHENPADFCLDIITPDNSSPEAAADRERQVASLIERYRASSSSTDSYKESDSSEPARTKSTKSLKRQETNSLMTSLAIPKKPGFLTQVFFLVQRSLKNQLRDKQFLAIRILSTLLMALIIGLAWLQLDDGQEQVSDLNGYLFFALIFVAFNELQAVITVFPHEREIFLHDRASGVYNVSSYLFSKLIADLPMHIIVPSLFVVVSYWMVGLNANFKDFIVILFILITMGLVTSSMGFCVSAATSDAGSANALSTVFNIFWVVFAGFFIRKNNIPDFLIWLHYIDPMKYGFGAMVLSQYHDGDKFKCTKKDLAEGGCPWKSSKQIHEMVGADDTDIWADFLILFAFIAFFITLTYLALKYLNKHR